MTDLVIDLKKPIEGSGGTITQVVFKKQPSAKHLIEFGSVLLPGAVIDWPVLAKYIDSLTELDFSEINRLSQQDFGHIGQKLVDWTFLDEKK